MQATGHEQFKRSQLPSHCRCGRKAATKGFVIQCTSEQMSGQKVRLVCKQRDQVVPEAVTNNLARFDGSTAQFNPIFAKNSGRGRTFSLWAEVLSREKEEVELTIDLLLPIKVTADGPRKRSADRTPSRASKSKLQSKQSSSVRCHSTLAVVRRFEVVDVEISVFTSQQSLQDCLASAILFESEMIAYTRVNIHQCRVDEVVSSTQLNLETRRC
eukprot:m.161059 g.161059  ORF g.161059 m.161059 type:complete len:214 (-) comp14358_c1_seq3:1840-2481(-)